jgi:hypothetical protein
MGGLAFNTQKARGVFLPRDCPPILPFTSLGIERLSVMHPEIFEDITTEKIDDKSKSGGLAKL